MLIPKENRKKIYVKLFNDGVMVAKKDYNAPHHPELRSIPNLQVIKTCQVRGVYLFLFLSYVLVDNVLLLPCNR